MVVRVKAYRPTSWWGVPTRNWKEDALCVDLPAELFELGDQEEITPDDQAEIIAQGLKVCAACPVRQACRDFSSEQDRYWTTRGGQPPEGLFPDSKMPEPERPNTGSTSGGKRSGKKKQERCHKGHKDWKIRPDGKRFCYTCKVALDANRDRSERPSRNRRPKGGTL